MYIIYIYVYYIYNHQIWDNFESCGCWISWCFLALSPIDDKFLNPKRGVAVLGRKKSEKNPKKNHKKPLGRIRVLGGTLKAAGNPRDALGK